jgi:hypothetical protein
MSALHKDCTKMSKSEPVDAVAALPENRLKRIQRQSKSSMAANVLAPAGKRTLQSAC